MGVFRRLTGGFISFAPLWIGLARADAIQVVSIELILQTGVSFLSNEPDLCRDTSHPDSVSDAGPKRLWGHVSRQLFDRSICGVPATVCSVDRVGGQDVLGLSVGRCPRRRLRFLGDSEIIRRFSNAGTRIGLLLPPVRRSFLFLLVGDDLC